MSAQSHNFSRYFPTEEQAKKWGWRLVDAGNQIVPKNSSYPANSHPNNYLFDNSGRRTLDEFQIIYIAEGQGQFESRSYGKTPVRSGQALLLFPGEWHNYRPDPSRLWIEYWLGFQGSEAERIVANFFNIQTPIIEVAHPDALQEHFNRILYWLKHLPRAKNKSLPAIFPLLLRYCKQAPP